MALNKVDPKKIHIIGSVGSGKTTLAKRLSTLMKIPYYELDNVVWIRCKTGDIRRTDSERDAIFHSIILSDCWIIEGAHSKWVTRSFENADLIIFLDTKVSKRKVRIVKRFVKQKLGLEKANYKPTFKIFKKMFQWNHTFETENKPEILKMLKKYDEKLLILQDSEDINSYIN